MHHLSWFKLIVGIALVLAAVTAVATEGSASITVGQPLELNGKQIAQGEYKVSWTGANDNLQVKIMAGKKEIATATAKLAELKGSTNSTALETRGGKLVAIRMGNKKISLVFTE